MSYDAPSTSAFLVTQADRRLPRAPATRAGRSVEVGRQSRGPRPVKPSRSKPTTVRVIPQPEPERSKDQEKQRLAKKSRPVAARAPVVQANMYAVLEQEGISIQDTLVVLDGVANSVPATGFVYKQHFKPYRTSRVRDSTRSIKPAKESSISDHENEGKGKEKVDFFPEKTKKQAKQDIFFDGQQIVKQDQDINTLVVTGTTIFFEEKDAVATSFFVDETKIVNYDFEFKIPQTDADRFFTGFAPVREQHTSQVGGQVQGQPNMKKKKKKKGQKESQPVTKPKGAGQPTKTKIATKKPSNKPKEPEEEEIEKLQGLMLQGFIPVDEFERRRTELANALKERLRMKQERERELKRIEDEERRKLDQAQKQYRQAKLEEERLAAARERLRVHQMKLKQMAEEGLGANISFDEETGSLCSASGVDLDKILQCVNDPDVAMQIFEYLVATEGKPKKLRKVNTGDTYSVPVISAAGGAVKGSDIYRKKKLNSMADVLHVLHVSGRSHDSMVAVPNRGILTPSNVLPTRENMHHIENIASKDPALVKGFLKQIKKERKLRTRYQRELQAWRLAVSDNSTSGF